MDELLNVGGLSSVKIDLVVMDQSTRVRAAAVVKDFLPERSLLVGYMYFLLC